MAKPYIFGYEMLVNGLQDWHGKLKYISRYGVISTIYNLVSCLVTILWSSENGVILYSGWLKMEK